MADKRIKSPLLDRIFLIVFREHGLDKATEVVAALKGSVLE